MKPSGALDLVRFQRPTKTLQPLVILVQRDTPDVNRPCLN
jgi:hypothetical protein